MSTEITFPLALCKAQWSIWLHMLEMFETLDAHALRQGIEETRAGTDTVMRAEDWQALAMMPVQVFWPPVIEHGTIEQGHGHASSCEPPNKQPASAVTQVHAAAAPTSRRDVVHDALCNLHTALAAAPVPHRSHAKAAATATRRKT